MARAIFGLVYFTVAAVGQEGEAVSFDFTCYDSLPPIRLDVAILSYAAWKWIVWLTARDGGEPSIAIPTAFTAIFVLAPYQVSWLVNPPAMIWLGLVGEATPWAAVAMVWTLGFGIMKGMEVLAERGRITRVILAS